MKSVQRACRFGVALFVCLAAGCGGEAKDAEPGVTAVRGTVTIGDKPLAEGARLSFTNDARGSSFVVVVAEDGAYDYTIPSGSKVVPGEYSVTIQPPPRPTITVDGLDMPDPNAPDMSNTVPQRFRSPETSGMTVNLEAGEAEYSPKL